MLEKLQKKGIIIVITTSRNLFYATDVLNAGEYPTKIYWAYNNELSKSIGLDFSKFMGTEVWIKIYNLNEPLPEFLKPQSDFLLTVNIFSVYYC